MKEKIETQDFKQLAREMKAFFGVGSLGEVAELLGYSRNSASSWYLCGRVPDRAVLAFYRAQEKGEKPALKEEAHAEFKQLAREMKAFFGVGSVKAVAKAMGFSVARANIWHRAKKFPDSVVDKFEQLRSQKQNPQQKQAPQKGLFSEIEATPPPPPSGVQSYNKEQIAELLHETRRAHGFKNWAQMGAAMDTPAGTLRAYSSGKTNGMPSLGFFAKLSRLADVSGILGGKPPIQAHKREHGDVLFKVYDDFNALGSAKAPMLSLELRARYPKNALLALGLPQGELVVVRFKNDSLSPLVEAGDYLLIEPCSQMRSGDIVVFEYAGEMFIRRAEKNPITGDIRFFSRNNERPDFELIGGADDKFEIVGVVRGKVKTF
ncbi:S24 family peptidase [Helicobacter cynogastricus]|uniref:S24 family peptidase n=1 Tax=Helicobacter cynogastricus TaxID=329937 RepID=UPI000CF0755A|nr:S24 family peptidase [Helicobacter cynogastricus]